MTVGERMKYRRKQIGMSAEQVAEKLEISPSTIYRYENGNIEKMGIDKLVPIASALHTTPAYLMGWTADWYDYETDEDSRFCEIPIAQFRALKEQYDDDLEAVWHAWEKIQEDAFHESQGKHAPEMNPILEGTYFRLAKGAQELGLNDDDVDAILNLYRKHKERNS